MPESPGISPRIARRALSTVGALAIVASAGTQTIAVADDALPMHQVAYTVTGDAPVSVHIYYRDGDPPSWSEYSHDPYRFSPRDEAQLEPDRAWVRQATLGDPMKWAMVAVRATAHSPDSQRAVRCELAIDGVVVDRGVGTQGALCSLRNW